MDKSDNMNCLTLGSLFDGLGVWLISAKNNGIRPLWCSEIEKFPIEVTKYHHPEVVHYGDVTKIDGADVPPVDIITSGSPCQSFSMAGSRCGFEGESGLFSETTRIIKEMHDATEGQYPKFLCWENVCFEKDVLITMKGKMKPISDVNIGDIVKTHTGEYKKVVDKQVTENCPVFMFDVMGSTPFKVTGSHPFLVRTRDDSKMNWKPVSELVPIKDFIGYKVDGFGTKSIGMANAYAVGRWLADGSIATRDVTKNNTGSHGGNLNRIFVSTGFKKEQSLYEELVRLPYRINRHRMKHAVNFTFTSDEFAKLIESCGRGARNKRIPDYTFDLIEEEQRELLRGYLDGDGYQRKGDRNREFSMSTSSRHLAFGLARLIRNVYNIGVSIACCQPKDGITFIEGRKVNAHEFWHLSFTIPKNETKFRRSFYSDGFVWCPVKDVKELDEHIDVYNITVEDNHTYEANGICVHNCGVHSSNEGHDFQKVLEEITEASIPMPKSGSWSASGMVRSRRCDVSWRVLDAQYWGVPQRRRRIFLIADYRTIRERRPEVCFVSKSLSGHFTQGEGKREGTSGTASKCFAISGHIVGRDTGNGGNGLGVCEDVAYTLTTVDRHAVCQVKSDSVVHAGFNMKASKTQGISFQPELSPTLQASKEMGVLSYDMTHADDVIRENRTDKIHTLNHRMGTGGNQVPLVQIYGQGGYGGFGKGVSTLRSSGGDCGYGSENLVMDSCLYDTQTQVVGAVRKLTPLECERLMGLPDNYTLIPHKSCSDSARYKAIGNSMAVPCSDYIMWVVKEMYNNG